MTQIALNVLSTAAADKIRTESFDGRMHTVVPLVALVEGVLQGATAENPELALAAEFGKYATAWDGRPVVMNHPQVDGQHVSANSPKVLEDWSFGILFNTQLVGDKLLTEAWLDDARINEAGGEVLEIYNSIKEGELIEVSTGLFATIRNKEGTFKGNAYKGVWESVAPDHLAILSKGIIGACSIKDGCGIPRINKEHAKTFIQSNPSDCGCHDHNDCQCDDHDTGSTDVNTNSDVKENNMTEEQKKAHLTAITSLSAQLKIKSDLKANELPGDMTFNNAREILTHALDNAEDCDFCYLCQLTRNKVVYFGWCDYTARQRSYTLTDNRSVTLGDDIEEVFLLTDVVPINNADEAPTLNSGGTEMSKETTGAGDAPKSNTKAEDGSTSAANPKANETPTGEETSADTNTDAKQTTAPAVNEDVTGSGSDAPAAPKTLSQALSDLPEEMREVMTESLALHADQKARLVKSLKDNERCEFSEDALKAMSIQDLSRIAKLANIPTFIGNAAAGADEGSNAASNSGGLQTFAVAPAFDLDKPRGLQNVH